MATRNWNRIGTPQPLCCLLVQGDWLGSWYTAECSAVRPELVLKTFPTPNAKPYHLLTISLMAVGVSPMLVHPCVYQLRLPGGASQNSSIRNSNAPGEFWVGFWIPLCIKSDRPRG